ncbi:unnamed protein product [Parnassius apollo]|uniref:(apollo) hypothetical protein n=1 Tax=Parnassius apollo TaxID=110799 RepID=A0A8S3XMH4_PARAO|nr:unnamed protein product [Parnassius apollo]
MNQKIVLTIVACFAIQSIYTTTGFSLQYEDSKNHISNSDTNTSTDISSILPFVTMIKGQVKEIIFELLFQILEYIKQIIQDCKVRFIKKLGKYSLADIFQIIFDGVVEFVKDEESGTTSKCNTTESTTEKPKHETRPKEVKVENGYSYDDEFQWSSYYK